MRNIIKQIKTTYGNLSNKLIEEYDRRQYMRFFKGTMIDTDNTNWPRVKVSLATACFYIGQGFGYIRGYISGIHSVIGYLRMNRRNRHK
jgi:hypothetical protein